MHPRRFALMPVTPAWPAPVPPDRDQAGAGGQICQLWLTPNMSCTGHDFVNINEADSRHHPRLSGNRASVARDSGGPQEPAGGHIVSSGGAIYAGAVLNDPVLNDTRPSAAVLERGRHVTDAELARKADWIRLKTIELVAQAGLGHYSSTFSCAEIVATLYYHVLRLDPGSPGWADRDR